MVSIDRLTGQAKLQQQLLAVGRPARGPDRDPPRLEELLLEPLDLVRLLELDQEAPVAQPEGLCDGVVVLEGCHQLLWAGEE
jgi:hypothetical protein